MKTYWFINTVAGPRIVLSEHLWQAAFWAEKHVARVLLAREAKPQEVRRSGIKILEK